MGFGWGHVFILAKMMFHKSDAQLAELLEVDRSTIYRHIKNPDCRFYPKVDVYNAIFALPNDESNTRKQYHNVLTISLNSDIFPEDFRSPKYKSYQNSIEYLLKKAGETSMLAKKKPLLQTENSSDDIVSVLSQEQAGVGQIFSENESTEIEEEEPQVSELSEPKYYREYRKDSLKMFEVYSAFNYSPLDPDLKEKWGTVCITDEFCKRIKDYEIEKFIAIAPSDLLPMGKVVTEGYVVNQIRSADRFVKHMKPAMDHMLITKENEKIFNDIVEFTALLHRYLKFLRENSNNSDLFASEFILMLSGDKELERKANEYHNKLKSAWEYLKKQLQFGDE